MRHRPASWARFILLAPVTVLAAAPTQVTFTLYKFGQRVGSEQSVVAQRDQGTEIRTAFAFTDRGTAVPLGAVLQLGPDGSARRFEVWGRTSRVSGVDVRVTSTERGIVVEEAGVERTAPAVAQFFVGAGYSPVIVIEALLRYWNTHGRPESLQTFPVGQVRILRDGQEAFARDDGKSATVDRWVINGLGWGAMTAWTDPDGALVGFKGVDAEFDHFEATRRGWAAALKTLIASAAASGSAQLARQRSVRPLNEGATLALLHATVVDGTGRAPLVDATILVDGDRIRAISPSASLSLPPATQTVDVSGKTVLPGLWDMHAHLEQAEWGPVYLAAGVTTVRDCANELEFVRSLRDAIDAGQGIGPRVLLACIVDGNGTRSVGVDRLVEEQDIPRLLSRFREAGCTQVKVYSSVAPRLIAPLARAAHSAGFTVTGHIPEGIGLLGGVRAGMDMVNHIVYVGQAMLGPELQAERRPEWFVVQNAYSRLDLASPRVAAVARELARRRVVVDPTVALYELLNHTPAENLQREPGLKSVPAVLRTPLETFGVEPDVVERAHRTWAVNLGILRALHRAGVPVVAGTDQAVPGHSLHRELEIYVEAGFSPLEAIQAATQVPARVMGRARELGTLEVGKRADLIVVDGNPLRDIHDIRRVVLTMSRGRLYETAPLWKSVGFESLTEAPRTSAPH